VGEDVLAIGNPLGSLGGTLTTGIISATERSIKVGGEEMVLLQTNAAINPGNSGGGLFNMAGELVGIVNAKKAAEGIEGLGFAIPIDLVSNIITEILEKGYISGRPTIGIEVEYGTPYFWAPYGVYVTSSDNEKFNIYDRLVSIDGQNITSILDYYAALDSSKIGKVIEVVVNRNNISMKIEVEVVEYRPDVFE
jgi:serine protease Do